MDTSVTCASCSSASGRWVTKIAPLLKFRRLRSTAFSVSASNAEMPEEDEGEIVAAITAAIAVMLQSEEYKGQFESGFRVVSFTRKGGAWNKQN